MFVLDASVVLSHCLAEPEYLAKAGRIVHVLSATTALVPAVWTLELSSSLLHHERSKRLTRKEVDELTTRWARMPVKTDTLGLSEAFGKTLALARKHNLSVYAASYLELAIRRRAPLATFDKTLREAVEREGVGLFEGLEE